MNIPKTLTVADAAEAVGMLPRTVRRYCTRGLVGQKVGRDWILSEADLESLARFAGRPPGNSPDWKNGKIPSENS